MKVILWIFLLVVLAVVGVGAYLFFNSGALIKQGIEAYGPTYLGASVSVSAVDLSLTEGTGEIRGLEIGNPTGFKGPYAMRLGQMRIELDPNQISEELVVIKRIVIDGADLAAEVKGTKDTNFQALLDNLERSSGESSSSDSGTDSSSELKFIIDQLDFTNAKTSVSSDIAGEFEVNIPDQHLQQLGRPNGATSAEITQELLRPITQSITKAAIAKGINLDDVKGQVESKVRDALEDKLGGGLDSLKGAFGRDD